MKNKFYKNLRNIFRLKTFLGILIIYFINSIFIYSQDARKIVGQALDINGEPLIGVNVQEIGTTNGIVTDVNGNYEITVSSPNSILKFSYIGFEEQQIKVENKTVINITMKESFRELEEVVVIGYGTMKKKDLTGAVASLNATKYEKEKNKNIEQILRGNIPGLNIGIATNAKGNSSILIRGQRSLSASSTPLIVLDGVIYNGDLTDINPNDIESIDILKDASSSAVFGAKSANGVVIINTKIGKTEKPIIGFDMSLGTASLFHSAEVYGPYEFLNWRSDVLKSINRSAPAYVFESPEKLPNNVSLNDWLAYDNAQGDPTDIWLRRIGLSQVERENYFKNQSTDWMKMVLGTGIQQSYNINISGSAKNLKYYWSLGYDDNEGVVKYDEFSVYRSRLKLDVKITDFLNVGINTLFSMRKEPGAAASWSMAPNISPWGQPTNPDGTMKIHPTDDAVAAKHPLIDRFYTSKDYTYKSLDNVLFAKITLPFNITYELRYAPRIVNNELYLHNSAEHAEYAKYGGEAIRNTSSSLLWQIDNIISWEKTIRDIHNFNVTLLANAEKNQTWQQIMNGRQFVPSDVLGYHNMGSATIPTISSEDSYSTGDAYMGRLFYSYRSKYLFTGTIRRDGYSAFGTGNPRSTFPSLALGWVFSEENFKKNLSWLDYGKLRLSWGETGNRSIGIYNALSTLSNNMITYVDNTGKVYQESYLNANRMGNRYLKWENTASTNLGIDFTLFNQRINGSIDTYTMNTTDLLVNRSLPSVTGYSSVTTNLGKVNNKGLEFTLNTINIKTPDFLWNTTFNFSFNKNRVKSLYGDMENIYDDKGNIIGQKEIDDIQNGWFINHAIDEIWDYKIIGVWQESEKEEASKYKLSPGDFKLEDVNKDYKFTNEDKSFQGYKTAPLSWSFRSDFTLFKNFDFSFLLHSKWNYKRVFNEAKHNPTMTLERFNSYKIPYWTPENPSNKFARLNSSMAGVSYNVWQDMSFIRLENVSCGYTFPKHLIEKINLSQLRLSLVVKNVFFYTKEFVLWDPEYAGPTPSYVTFGINFSL